MLPDEGFYGKPIRLFPIKQKIFRRKVFDTRILLNEVDSDIPHLEEADKLLNFAIYLVFAPTFSPTLPKAPVLNQVHHIHSYLFQRHE